ncbi:MAG TPA: DUF374 domain-containing protein [Syntrophorhabdaceae bacterium]|nr:DUF374 domain-containing protein [Syntrophorhabdaceae bacterium]
MAKPIKSFLMLKIFPPLIWLFLTILKSTLRIEHINKGQIEDAWANGMNFIICFWHGRLLMMPFAKEKGGGKVLISRHRDGELIARVVRLFGLMAIRGSYRKGSVSSLREIIRDLKAGVDVAITPDGPKGPGYKVKEGIVELAGLSGKAIVPLTYGAGKKKLFIPGTGLLSPTLFPGLSFSGVTRSLLTTP